ncbi:MAG: Mur ligase family protein, partial [Acidimicrobiales bacterium]
MKAAATGLERLRDCRVAVWGAGVEGRAVAREAISRGSSVVFVDDRPGLGSVHVDGADLPVRSPSALADERCDYLVRSPGVSLYRDELADVAKSGCTVTSATAMWLEDFEGSRVVGVTGTKGKTTTAWITKLLLEACGLRVALGGNMGTPLTALYSEPSDVYVVEISSFQAADITVSPPVGVLTLVAPDHLDWHHGYGNYVRDKLNLFDHSRGIDVAVNS